MTFNIRVIISWYFVGNNSDKFSASAFLFNIPADNALERMTACRMDSPSAWLCFNNAAETRLLVTMSADAIATNAFDATE